jgi:hypothetical protein
MKAAANQPPPSSHQKPRATATRSPASQHPGSREEPPALVAEALAALAGKICRDDLASLDGVRVLRSCSDYLEDVATGILKSAAAQTAIEADPTLAALFKPKP